MTRGILLGLLSVYSAAAQEALIPIHVQFQFGDPAIPAPAGSEQALTELFTNHLQQEWKLWKFVAVSTPQYPLLRLRLQRNLEWDLRMSLIVAAGQPPASDWTAKLFSPGDLTRLGDSLPVSIGGWKPELRRCLVGGLIDRHRASIFKALRANVPVGQRVEWAQATPSAAPVPAFLHVPRDSFADLASHKFEIKSSLASEPVTLYSQGTAYEQNRGAIKVLVFSWSSPSTGGKVPILGQLRHVQQLRPMRFFLGDPFDPNVSVAP